jgi:ankyrin repeat protein
MSKSSGERPEIAGPRKRLPVNPSAEYLRKQAKRKSRETSSVSLANAQHQLAREYGCANWAELMRVVETMSRGADQLAHVKAEMEPLPAAANRNDLAGVRAILEKGPFTQHDLDLALARSVLAFREREEIAELLVEHGADPDGQYGSNYGPIALVTGECLDPDGLEFLIGKGADVAFAPIDSKYGKVSMLGNVLGTYVRGRNDAKHRCVEILLREGAAVPAEVTPVMMSIHRGDAEQLAGFLDREPGLAGRRIGAMPYGNIALAGGSLLHMAVEYGEIACVNVLLDRWADINCRADVIDGVGGQTPIFHAINSFQAWLRPVLDFLIHRVGEHIDMGVCATFRQYGKVIGPCTPLEWAKENADEVALLLPIDGKSQLKEAIRREDDAEVRRLLDGSPGLLGVDLWPAAIYEARSLSMTRLLAERGLDVNECSAPRKPLHLAVYQCLPDVVAYLIVRGADVNRRNPLGETPLELLDAYEPRPVGDADAKRIREMLVGGRAEEDIFAAVRAGDAEAVREMLKVEPDALRAASSIGGPLIAAARSGRAEVARVLMERGAKVDEANDRKNTPLWFACQSPARGEDRVGVAQVLLDGGADVNRRCEEGSTALHFAAWRGPAEMVELLLSRGARNWIADDKGRLPLDRARETVASDKEAIVRLLGEVRILDPIFREAVTAIDEGALDTLRDLLARHPALVRQRAEEEGWYAGPYFRHPTLLHFVAGNPKRSGELPGNIREMAEAILDAGADVDAEMEGANGGTTLALVASSEPARKHGLQIPLIELLAGKGADPTKGLEAAMMHNEMDAVRVLLRYGARHTLSSAAGMGDEGALRDLLAATSSGADRLAAAAIGAMHGHAGCVEMLLATGLDINARLVHPYSPTLLHQAAWSGHRGLVEALLSLGADPSLRDTQFDGTPADWARVNGHGELSQLIEARIRAAS